MYSPEGSSGDPINSREQAQRWVMGTSRNMSKDQEQIDWAALAQQWIQMKESCTDTSYLNAPPPPRISGSDLEEKGEAPMEVVKDDEIINSSDTISNNGVVSNYADTTRVEWQANSWLNTQCQWRTGWESWTQPNAQNALQPVDIMSSPTIPIGTMKDASIYKCTPEVNGQVSGTSAMDAAKRKALPAWIREGLEKMEREKQKQLEKEKVVQHEDVLSKYTNNPLTNVDKRLPIVVNSELFEDNNTDNEEDDNRSVDSETKIEVNKIGKSKEELFEEMMLLVRRTLTEILLEVTNEEILTVAQESLRRSKVKASSAQVFRKSAISSITGKLGLGAYADSASENSNTDNESAPEDTNYDSEEEIRENVRARQNAFKVVAQEIEARAAENELRDQRRNNDKVSETHEKSNERESGETQPGKNSGSNGKKTRERTSRFSDAKDYKYKSSGYIMHNSLPSSSNDYEKKKSSTVAKQHTYSSESSSDSYDNYRKHKKTTRDKTYKTSIYSKRDRERERSRYSSDSDERTRTRHRNTYSRDKSRSRSQSRSRSRSYTGRRH